MKDYLVLGPVPYEEMCVQCGDKDFDTKAKRECNRFIKLLRSKFGDEPEGNEFAVMSFPHDFGSYYEVVVWYDEEIQSSVDFAFKVDSEVPATW